MTVPEREAVALKIVEGIASLTDSRHEGGDIMMEEKAKINSVSGLLPEEERRIRLFEDVDNAVLSKFIEWWNIAQVVKSIYERKSEAKKEDA